MNKYAAIFFGFIAIVMVAYFTTRQTANSSAASLESASGKESKQEVVVKKYSDAEKAKFLNDTSGDYFLGNAMAPVVLIEYASLSCPHCADFHEKVVDPLMPTYIESGKVKYVFRDFPLNAPALEASKIAHCAGPEKFFSFIKVLFQSQNNWVIPGTPEIKKIAALGGITAEQYDKCIKDPTIENKILKTQKDANEILGVKSTPTIFINGIQYKGEHNFEDVSESIDKYLKGGAN